MEELQSLLEKINRDGVEKAEAEAAKITAAAKAEAEKELGADGRMLLRKSGTEPVLRVMAEAKTHEAANAAVEKVLSAIKDKESYGYQIIKDMKPYLAMSESTLYTILKRLELAGMLTIRTAEHEGRLRKYYRITRAGLGRIEDFKDEWREVMSIYRFVTKEDTRNDLKGISFGA